MILYGLKKSMILYLADSHGMIFIIYKWVSGGEWTRNFTVIFNFGAYASAWLHGWCKEEEMFRKDSRMKQLESLEIADQFGFI